LVRMLKFDVGILNLRNLVDHLSDRSELLLISDVDPQHILHLVTLRLISKYRVLWRRRKSRRLNALSADAMVLQHSEDFRPHLLVGPKGRFERFMLRRNLEQYRCAV